MQQPSLTPAVHAGSLARTGEFQTAGVHAPPSVQWTFTPPSPELPRTAISTPVLVHQEVAYLGCSDGCVYALDRHDGAVRWTFATHDPDPDPEDVLYGEEVHPEVTGLCLDVESGYAYVGSAAGVIYEVDLATGGERRRWILPDLLSDVELDEAYIIALTLAGDRLVFAIGAGFSQIFVVLDRRTDALSMMDSSPGSFSIKALTLDEQLAIMLSIVNHQGEANAFGIRLPDAPNPYLFPSWATVAQDWDADARDMWGEETVDVSATDGYLPVYDDTLFAVGVILRQHTPGESEDSEDDEETAKEDEEDEADDEEDEAEDEADDEADDDDAESAERLLALNPRTSELLWSCEGLSDLDGYSTSRTLAAAYGLVFVYMGEYGMLDAVDSGAHQVRWRWRSPSTHPHGRHERSSRPRGTELFIADGLLYVIEHGEASRRENGGEGSMRIFALDAHSGALSWSWSQLGDSAIGHEVRSTIADGVLYLVGWRTVYALR